MLQKVSDRQTSTDWMFRMLLVTVVLHCPSKPAAYLQFHPTELRCTCALEIFSIHIVYFTELFLCYGNYSK